MPLSHAIVLVFLIEAVVLLALVCGVLWWRLRHAGAASSPEAAGRSLQELLQAEIAGNLQRLLALPDDDTEDSAPLRRALNARTRALEAEQRLQGLTDDAERDSCVLQAFGEPTRSEDEVDRLRRLLHREERRVGELLGLRDAIRELKLRFERLARLAEQLTDPELIGDARAAVMDEYGEAASAYSGGFDSVATQLEALTGDLEKSEPAAAKPADTDSLRAVIGQQAETISRLRDRMSTDEADNVNEELDQLGRQMVELETCVQVLQDENDYLYNQLRGLEAASSGEDVDVAKQIAELEQALAMKEKQVDELREPKRPAD